MSDIRIIFMGTPEFAVESLKALLDAGFNVAGVVTAPDKPAGRGLLPGQSAVKKFADEQALNILQPVKLKDEAFINELDKLQIDLQVVVAFRMLPEIVWNKPPMGTINVHGSLLPQYRGAAPINWAIMNGETETGVTTFKLKHQIDTGNILMQEKITIGENETAGVLHDRMKLLGAELLVKTINGLDRGDLKEISQADIDPTTLKHAPKIYTDDCRINFDRSVDEVHNQVRGLSPFPGAFTQFQNKTLKIFRTSKGKTGSTQQPGIPETDGRSRLSFSCADGFIDVLELQMEGKKRLNVADFLRGFRFEI